MVLHVLIIGILPNRIFSCRCILSVYVLSSLIPRPFADSLGRGLSAFPCRQMSVEAIGLKPSREQVIIDPELDAAGTMVG